VSAGYLLAGRYLVEAELARGGMGVVYRGRTREGRPVAIKSLLPSSEAARRRFLREAAALRQLRHPNVVGVLDAGEERGQPYLVLELVPGESLQERLARGGPLEPPAAAALVGRVARAAQHAHELGVLHRDIKPANVLIDADGAPRLTDFGLAKDLDAGASALTRSGRALGSPGYWPPEQAVGDLERIDARSDVYALGATLFAALTGRPPFEGADLTENIVATIEEPPPRPSQLRADVDPALEWLCLRCLEKEPDDRYPTPASLAVDVERWLRGELEPGRLRPRRSRRARQVRRVLGLGAAGGVLVGAALAVGWIATRARGGAAEAASTAPTTSSPADPAAAPDPRALVEEAEALRAAGDAAAATEAVERALAAAPEHAPAWALRGRLAEAGGDLAGARSAFERALALEPNRVDALLGRGRVLLAAGATDEATAAYERALELAGDGAAAQAGLGRALLAAREWEPAAKALTLALAYRDHDADLWRLRGLAHLAYGQAEAAEADLTRALELLPPEAPAAGEALVARSRSRLAQYDWEGARADAEQAIERGVDSARGWTARAAARCDVHGHDADYEGAVADADRALELDSDALPALLTRAAARVNLGDFELALADAARALELERTSAHAFYVRGAALRAVGRFDDALAALEKALELDPVHFPSLEARSILRRELGDDEAADADEARLEAIDYPRPQHGAGSIDVQSWDHHTEAHQVLPEDASIGDRLRRSSIRAHVGHFELAIEDLDAVLAEDPEHADATGQRAYYRLVLGELEAGLDDAVRATELDPDGALDWSRLALFRALLGDGEAALAAADRAVELDHRRPRAWARRARALLALGQTEEAVRNAHRAVVLEENRHDHARSHDHGAEAYETRGEAWLALGERERARVDLGKALTAYSAADPRARRVRDRLAPLLPPDEPLPSVFRPHWQLVRLHARWQWAHRELDPAAAPLEELVQRATRRLQVFEPGLAEEDLDAVLARDGEHAEARALRSTCRLRQGDAAAAVADAAAAVALEPDAPGHPSRLARARLAGGDAEAALASAEAALERWPGSVGARVARAAARLALGEPAAAVADADAALERDPERDAAYAVRARARAALGEGLAAYRDFERAIDACFPGDPAAARYRDEARAVLPEGAELPELPEATWRDGPPGAPFRLNFPRRVRGFAPTRWE